MAPLDDLKAGVGGIRNRVIVRVLRKLGLVKEWGTGFRRVTQACEEGGYPPPAWQELGAALRVIFEPHPEAAAEDGERSGVPINEPVNEPVNTRQQWFIAQIVAGQQPGWVDLAQHWQVSRATARRDIVDLKARGLIESVQQQIFQAAQTLKEFPNCANVKRLTNHRYGYRLRIGSYRLFFDFQGDEARIVSIEEVKKRDEHTC